MIVLLLAPEAYWPLRRLGAEFHAAAEGTATFDCGRRAARPPRPPRGPVSDDLPGWWAVRGVTVTYRVAGTGPRGSTPTSLVPG